MSETKCRVNMKSTDARARDEEAARDIEPHRHQKSSTTDSRGAKHTRSINTPPIFKFIESNPTQCPSSYKSQTRHVFSIFTADLPVVAQDRRSAPSATMTIAQTAKSR
jgi:hypothetical protein